MYLCICMYGLGMSVVCCNKLRIKEHLPVEYHSIFVCLGRCKFRLMLYLGNTSGVMRLIVH